MGWLDKLKNKKDETQAELRDKMRTQYDALLKKNSLTDSAFQRRRFMLRCSIFSTGGILICIMLPRPPVDGVNRYRCAGSASYKVTLQT